MPHQRTIPRVCEQCSGNFLAEASEVRAGNGRYCSRACTARAQALRSLAVPRMERFMAKVAKQSDGCWHWIGARANNGYGVFWDGVRLLGAHRYAYAQLVGEIPVGFDLDHLCRVRHCVNPEHVEPVTRQINAIRGKRWPR